jgi:subtilisin family serine protease
MAGSGSILHVAAAGNSNSNNDSKPQYPSSYDIPNLIAVASTTSSDGRSSFSNYGATSVDLGAPGSDIYSTVLNDGYGYKSGTSMATPHVAGAAALLMANYTEMSAQEARSRILGTVDQVSSLTGITVTGGRLNVYQSLDTAHLAAPSELSGSYNTATGKADLLWSDNTNSQYGFANETGFEIWRAPKPKGSSAPSWGLIATTPSDTTAYSDSFSSGQFLYRVKAANGSVYTNQVLVSTSGGGGGGGKGGGRPTGRELSVSVLVTSFEGSDRFTGPSPTMSATQAGLFESDHMPELVSFVVPPTATGTVSSQQPQTRFYALDRFFSDIARDDDPRPDQDLTGLLDGLADQDLRFGLE